MATIVQQFIAGMAHQRTSVVLTDTMVILTRGRKETRIRRQDILGTAHKRAGYIGRGSVQLTVQGAYSRPRPSRTANYGAGLNGTVASDAMRSDSAFVFTRKSQKDVDAFLNQLNF